uniref:Uncharacterized protein n=1 Tax=Dulem virus 258 TaxID=3145735 RepID=A0AAU8B866_9VIRU
MLTKIVDCCHLTAQENEPRVTFTTEFYENKPKGNEVFMHAVRREHIPLSAAMQIIATDRQIPNGFYECYLIEPEND